MGEQKTYVGCLGSKLTMKLSQDGKSLEIDCEWGTDTGFDGTVFIVPLTEIPDPAAVAGLVETLEDFASVDERIEHQTMYDRLNEITQKAREALAKWKGK